jgi:hypothetical protein
MSIKLREELQVSVPDESQKLFFGIDDKHPFVVAVVI